MAAFFQEEVITLAGIIEHTARRGKIKKLQDITFPSNLIEKIKHMDIVMAEELMRKSVRESLIYGVINKKE